MEQIIRNLKVIRELQNVTQEYLAEQLGISQNAYAKIEHGETKLTYQRLEQIANVFKIPITSLITMNDKLILQTIENNQAITTEAVTINNIGKERELYEIIIKKLEDENKFLKELLESKNKK